MEINERLYVKIVPFEGDRVPQPHPVDHGRFDTGYVYKVLGMYNPSETGESYFILSNPFGEIWFISNRHLRAYGLIDSGDLFIESSVAKGLLGRPAKRESGNGHFPFRIMNR